MFSGKIRKLLLRNQFVRQIHRDEKIKFVNKLPLIQSVKKRLISPASPTAFIVGQRILVSGSVLGFGYLCYYGLNSQKDLSIQHQSIILETYKYVGSSLAICLASSIAVFHISSLLNVTAKLNWVTLSRTVTLLTGSSIAAKSLPYESGFHRKQLAWTYYCYMMGASLSPIVNVGWRILLKAGCYAVGAIGGLSIVAVCAPNKPIMQIRKPIAYGTFIILISSISSMMLPPTTQIGAVFYSLTVYGGLLVFGASLICDTQRVIHKAESYPPSAVDKFDPILQ